MDGFDLVCILSMKWGLFVDGKPDWSAHYLAFETNVYKSLWEYDYFPLIVRLADWLKVSCR